jgi:hypothetical protein
MPLRGLCGILADTTGFLVSLTENHGVGSSILPLGTTLPWQFGAFPDRLQDRRSTVEAAERVSGLPEPSFPLSDEATHAGPARRQASRAPAASGIGSSDVRT